MRGAAFGLAVAALAIAIPIGRTALSAAAVEEPGATASPHRASRVTDAAKPPIDVSQLDPWLSYQQRAHIIALPAEARLFHRRGRIAFEHGEDVEAVHLMRGAATLDPSYPNPQLALASWFLTRQPAQALQSYASLLGQLRSSFLFQLDLAANALFWIAHALFLGLLAAGLLMVVVHQHELRHVWSENLHLVLTRATAKTWAWAFLVLPFSPGLGITLPVVVLLAMSWPVLRARERFVFIALVVAVAMAPLVAPLVGRVVLPLRSNEAPYFGVTAIEHEPWSAARQAELADLSAHHPENPFLLFGLGWVSRLGDDLRTAETAYRRLLERTPSDDRALNNLGNVLAIQGRFDEALELFKRASGIAPRSAAPWFNASQIHTRRFDYAAANDALARASALDFDMVKAYQSASADGLLPLVDEWMSPAAFWRAVLHPGPGLVVKPDLPPPWRGAIETSGWGFTALTLALTFGALALGIWWHRRVPLRACSNCGQVVCRRCAERRREVALCPTCASASARAESTEFARVLLDQQRRKNERHSRLLRTVVATIVPGFGLLSCRRVFGPLFLLMLSVLVFSVATGLRAPFAFSPRIGPDAPPLTLITMAAILGFVYLVSITGYFARRSQSSAPPPLIKARPTTPSAVSAEAA